MLKADYLKNTPLFIGLTEEEIALVAERMQTEKRVKNERIFQVGEGSDALYLLGRGFVNLTTDSGLTIATLGAGSTLGEADLFRDAQHTLNAVAASDIELWSLSSTSLSQILQHSPTIGVKLSSNFGEPLVQMEGYLVNRLALVPALGDLPQPALLELARCMRPQYLQAGEILYRASATPDGLFLVESGEVRLRSTGGRGESTNVRAGQLMGVQALLTNRLYRHDATAVEESLIWQLSPADFQTVNRAYPGLRRNLGRTISARLDPSEQLGAVVRLAQMPLFAQVDPQGLQAIARSLVPQHFTAGEPIYRLDEPGDALFLVQQGEVELTIQSPSGVVEELARVADSGHFGEMSLLTGKKRTEAATVTRDANVWVLYKNELETLVGQYPSIGTSLSQGLANRLAAAETQVDENRFRRFALFTNSNRAELRDVAQRLRPTRYRAGEAIYRAGTRGDTMFLIEQGTVRLQPYSGSSWVLGAGEFFGEKAVLTDKPRSVSVFAESEVDLLTLSKQDLEALMMQHPTMGLNLSRALSQRVNTQGVAAVAPVGPMPDVPGAQPDEDAAQSRSVGPAAGNPAYVSPAAVRRRRAASDPQKQGRRSSAGIVAWFTGLSTGGKMRAALLALLLIWLFLIAAPMTLIGLINGSSIASGESVPVTANALAAVAPNQGIAVAMVSDQALALEDQLVMADQEVAPTATFTPPPTQTAIPTATPTATATPTNTPLPTVTPTFTPVPPTPVPVVVQAQPAPQEAAVAAASVEEPAAPALPPRIWDGRLNALGVSVAEAPVGSGQQYWRLVEARWQNEEEGGGKHNIYVETLDPNGSRMTGVPVAVLWADGGATQVTENKPAPDYAFSYPMYAAGQSYTIKIEDGKPSDALQGAGLGDLTRRSWSIHVNYILIYQLTTAP
jgi:CRP-like cAMP-binding protein